MAGDFAEALAELIAAGGVQFPAVVVRRHPVGFVDHDQVPVTGVQQGQQVVTAGQLVHAGDQDRVAGEWVAVDEVGDHFPGQQFGGDAELGGQFVLPLLDQAAGAMMSIRFRSPRSMSSLAYRPAMIVLPAPGSSASRNRSGFWAGARRIRP